MQARAFILIALVAAVVVTGACRSGAGSAPPATTAAAGEKTRTAPQLDAEPTVRQAAGKLLPEVPQFPAYPGASLLGSAERNSPDAPKQGHLIEWTTTDPVPKVMAWYQKALPEAGWTYSPPTDGVTHSQLAGIARDGLDGTLEVEFEDGLTRITVVLKPKR